MQDSVVWILWEAAAIQESWRSCIYFCCGVLAGVWAWLAGWWLLTPAQLLLSLVSPAGVLCPHASLSALQAPAADSYHHLADWHAANVASSIPLNPRQKPLTSSLKLGEWINKHFDLYPITKSSLPLSIVIFVQSAKICQWWSGIGESRQVEGKSRRQCWQVLVPLPQPAATAALPNTGGQPCKARQPLPKIIF